MRNYRLSNSIGVGGSLIMIIFVMLCLTVFSVLSFTTAYSDLKLSLNLEEATKDYYIINGKGEKKLEEISESLSSIKTRVFKNNFNDVAIENLKHIDSIVVTDEIDYVKVCYEALGNENQKICVTLKISFDEQNYRPYYEILSWNLTSLVFPEYDDATYDLWEGVEENLEN